MMRARVRLTWARIAALYEDSDPGWTLAGMSVLIAGVLLGLLLWR